MGTSHNKIDAYSQLLESIDVFVLPCSNARNGSLVLKNRPFSRRLAFAIAGLRTAFRTEASFRTQCAGATFALLLLLILRPAPLWWAVLALSVAGVLAFELLNTSLEAALDHLHPERHPEVARAKDCAAGAVLVLSLASLIVAAALLFESLS
jgi:undecaprenol kinase